jgi:hypothetical protein
VRGNNNGPAVGATLRAARKSEARRQIATAADGADALLSYLAISGSYNNVPPSRAGGAACAVRVGAKDSGNAAIDLSGHRWGNCRRSGTPTPATFYQGKGSANLIGSIKITGPESLQQFPYLACIRHQAIRLKYAKT